MKRSREAKKQQHTTQQVRQRVRTRSRSAVRQQRPKAEEINTAQYWMRCPRCGLGLIETVKGPISTERCTACGAVWADREDVERAWSEGTPELFKPF